MASTTSKVQYPRNHRLHLRWWRCIFQQVYFEHGTSKVHTSQLLTQTEVIMVMYLTGCKIVGSATDGFTFGHSWGGTASVLS